MEKDELADYVFTRDMLTAEHDVVDYNGRYFYHGPAVRVDDMNGVQAVIRATSVPVVWDNMGKGWIVYPKR